MLPPPPRGRRLFFCEFCVSKSRFLVLWHVACRSAGSKVRRHVACRGRWVESDAGMSHAGSAGSKVTLACLKKGQQNYKIHSCGLRCAVVNSYRWVFARGVRWYKTFAGMSHAEAAGSKVTLATWVAENTRISDTEQTHAFYSPIRRRPLPEHVAPLQVGIFSDLWPRLKNHLMK